MYSLQFPVSFVEEVKPKARPFLKWAGGKGQLLGQISSYLPADLQEGRCVRYAEPFIGGGAVLFFIMNNFAVRECFIADINQDLILAYRTIRSSVDVLLELLDEMQAHYIRLHPAQQKEYFYETRRLFNHRNYTGEQSLSSGVLLHVARLIFLNRTCFNGLYRVNSSGDFNVPFGSYRNPTICDAANVRAVSRALQNVDIHHGDFSTCRGFVDEQTFVYFDPPYRPLSRTASFTSYAKDPFDDTEQRRLALFYRDLDRAGAKLLLSNSDPQNENPHDTFFENLYEGFSLHKVAAKRAINSNGAKRGEITELLITNY